MVASALAILAAVSAAGTRPQMDSAQSLLHEETPDVFLAKATLQQYLSRIVRRDWDGVKRLTHPKARSLQPWAARNEELKTFEFKTARPLGPGTVAIEMAEGYLHLGSRDMSTSDPAVYLLFKTRGTWRVGDRKPGARIEKVSVESVRSAYPGWVDQQALVQARRADRLAGKHR
jgi:hypothetical protein